jgi:NAD(P)-dependent dehydrogenase (short-subunit alcohol dehydrogenase family)
MGEIGETVSTPGIGSIPGGYAIDHEQKRNRDELQRTGILPRGIRVNAVSPGPVETPLNDKLGIPDAYREQANKDIISTIPFGRFGKPEEVAKAVIYLASDEPA